MTQYTSVLFGDRYDAWTLSKQLPKIILFHLVCIYHENQVIRTLTIIQLSPWYSYVICYPYHLVFLIWRCCRHLHANAIFLMRLCEGISVNAALCQGLLLWCHIKMNYPQTSDISRTLIGNAVVDHTDVIAASPAGAALTISSFST